MLLESFGMRNDLVAEIYHDRKQNLDPNNLKGVIDNIILLCQDEKYLQEAGSVINFSKKEKKVKFT